MIALSRYPSASWASDNVEHSDSDGPGFTIRRQARQTDRPNRVHKSYGLVVLLQLLPTPPRDDAVTFRYRPESAYLKRTHTSRIKQTCKRTVLSLRDLTILDRPPCCGNLGHKMPRPQLAMCNRASVTHPTHTIDHPVAARPAHAGRATLPWIKSQPQSCRRS